MRSALVCVLVALIITNIQENKADEDGDFRPTPIPLDYWNDRRSGRAGTLHQINKTDSPPTVAAVPAHYWEDALRHSVYLTLVRDKIDQLIASGAVISPDSKPDYASKEVDDHDLWEKIKIAPFDRLAKDEHTTFGDVTVMSRGRLMNEKDGYRFTEDEASKEKCVDKCLEGVKALWSVKRMRQREPGAPSGKYHYELTFSVTSQSPRKQRKPYENPVRTFTVRENPPQEPQRVYDISQKQRPQRAIWFHKNIVPTKHHHSQYNQGLDRIFSSFFSDEESYVETPRYKQQNPYVPQMYPQLNKAGHVSGQNDPHHQKKFMPHNYKPNSFKYSRPPLSAPPLSHIPPYPDFDLSGNTPYPPPPPSPLDHIRYQSSNVVKTTRPAVLPTPVMPVPPPSYPTFNNYTTDDLNLVLNTTISTMREPEIITGFKSSSNPKPAPMKVSYFPDHVRPPVYNAPPGVFVTMDKKPFKPMPPLKLVHNSKPMRSKPVDFRPSPQVLDSQFSNLDAVPDSAFRPITMNYADESNTTEKLVIPQNNKRRKPSAQSKKSQKKHENTKSHPTITSAPEIITVNNDSREESESMDWANLLGAFTKTTPMVSYKHEINKTESKTVTSAPATTTTTTKPRLADTTTKSTSTTTTTTTPKPTKRTRPPPNFTKPEKIKKHKRITTTTTTTAKPAVRPISRKPTQDLTPQASSAATSRPAWKPKNKIISTTPMTTTTGTSTTTKPSGTTVTTTQSTTTIASTASTVTNDIEPSSTQPKIKNRYRQSTLMIKGTSVKHDKWNVNGADKNKTIVSSKYPPRRKGSNFQGYVFPKRKTTELEHTKEEQVTVSNMKDIKIVNDTEKENEAPKSTSPIPEISQTSTTEKTESSSVISTDPQDIEEEDEFEEDTEEPEEESDDQETKDHTEYIFNVSTTPVLAEKVNDVEDRITTTEQIITTTPYTVPKNKTKCKKKKLQNLTTIQGTILNSDIDNESTTSATTTTKGTSTTESFVDFFEEFILNEKPQTTSAKSTTTSTSTSKPELDEGESENHDIYVRAKDDFQMFMDSLEKDDDDDDDDEDYDNDDNEDYSPFNNVEENSEARNADSDYADYQDRSYGLLELMPME